MTKSYYSKTATCCSCNFTSQGINPLWLLDKALWLLGWNLVTWISPHHVKERNLIKQLAFGFYLPHLGKSSLWYEWQSQYLLTNKTCYPLMGCFELQFLRIWFFLLNQIRNYGSCQAKVLLVRARSSTEFYYYQMFHNNLLQRRASRYPKRKIQWSNLAVNLSPNLERSI